MEDKTKTVPSINGEILLDAKFEGNYVALTATLLVTGEALINGRRLQYHHRREFAQELLQFEIDALNIVNSKSSLDWPFDLAGWK